MTSHHCEIITLSAIGAADWIAGYTDHRSRDNSVGADAVRNDRLLAVWPKDLDERLPSVTALRRERVIAVTRVA